MHESTFTSEHWSFFVLGYMLSFVVTLWTCIYLSSLDVVDARENVRKEAVKAGVAEYVPGENGDPVFQWRKVVE